MSLRRRTVLVVPALAALSLAGCGLSGQQPESTAAPSVDTDAELSGSIDFQTWALKNETFTPYFEDLIASFEAEHPGTTINWIDQPGDGYQDKLLQQVQTDALPDVVNLPPDIAYQVQLAGALLDLEAADPDAITTYTPGGVDAYRYDGLDGAYGYPWYLGTDLAWWNTDLIAAGGGDPDALPSTFEEMADLAVTMADGDGVPLFSSAPGIGDLAAEGVPIFENGEFVFNTSEGAAILQRYVDLYAAGGMPPEALNQDYAGNTELYKQESVAFTTGTASFYTDLSDNAPSLLESTVVTPRIGAPPLFVQGISVAAGSDNPALALAFAQYVTNNENQVAFVQIAQGFLPGTVEANENPESFSSAIDDPLVQEAVALAAQQMADAQMQMPVQWSGDMDTFAKQQIALALRGDISAQEALDAIVENANATLS